MIYETNLKLLFYGLATLIYIVAIAIASWYMRIIKMADVAIPFNLIYPVYTISHYIGTCEELLKQGVMHTVFT